MREIEAPADAPEVVEVEVVDPLAPADVEAVDPLATGDPLEVLVEVVVDAELGDAPAWVLVEAPPGLVVVDREP